MGDRVEAFDQDSAKRAAAEALSLVESGPGKGLGTELFDQVARHSVSYAFEAVAIRRNENGHLMVYLMKRRDDDTAYPGQYHCPGSVRRPFEKWGDVATRLSRGEFKAAISNFRKVGEIPTNAARGSFVSVVYLINLEGETSPEKWFPVNGVIAGSAGIPVVDIHQQMLIPLAEAAFEVEEAEAELESKRARLSELKSRFCD